MVDAGSILSFTATTGIEALSILNQWLDKSEVEESWYGKDRDNFVRKRGFVKTLFRKKYVKPEISQIFTIQKEDWQLVIKESLPVAHTWYRKRKDQGGECSWLPLFWACEKSLGKDRVCQEAESAFTSLGIVSNLPAARLDLWGLVVMAYANGAWGHVRSANDGGFRATLFGRNFILDISQANINAPTLAHLEPREHPSEDREPLGIDETRYLLDHGHSFSAKDVLIGWPLNGDPESQPPGDLVNGQWDKQLRKVVLDQFKVRELQKGLAQAILDYRNAWVDLEANAAHDFQGVVFRGMSSTLCEVEAHMARVKKPHIAREARDVGLDPESIASEEVDGPLTKQTTELRFPAEWKGNIKQLGELIDVQLWRIKLLFCDDVKLVDNQNWTDVLHVFKEEGSLIEAFSLHYLKDPHIEHSPPAIAASHALDTLMHRHRTVAAKARMLRFCEQIDGRLSTRNTGYSVLLG